jgi:ATP-dependent Clp protease, protease subunit
MTDMIFGRGPDADASPWSRQVRDRLFDQRVVFISGRLDHQAGGQAAMELMTLDAAGDGAIHLQLESTDGELDAALSLMDVIDLLGVAVRVTALGAVGGPAVGVLALGHHRMATPHARFALAEPTTSFEGPARNVEQWAEDRRARWRLFCTRLAEAVGRETEAVVEDFDAGRYLGADEALSYGLIDEITRPDPGVVALRPRPVGFGPLR